MGFLRAGHLGAQRFVRRKQRICQRDEAVPVVDGVDASEPIAAAQRVIGARGAEIFADRLAGIIVGERRPAPALRTVGLGPKGHVCEHRRIQIGDLLIHSRGVWQQAQARFGVGNHSDVSDCQGLAETFVVAE